MSWLAKIWSMFFGGSGGATVVDDGIKLADHVVSEVHDHNERVAGADHVTAETNAQAAKVNENVANAAAANTDAGALDQLLKGRG